jgi:hypothetical protein
MAEGLGRSSPGAADSALEARFLVSVFAELTGESLASSRSRRKLRVGRSVPGPPGRLNANRLK